MPGRILADGSLVESSPHVLIGAGGALYAGEGAAALPDLGLFYIWPVSGWRFTPPESPPASPGEAIPLHLMAMLTGIPGAVATTPTLLGDSF